MARTAHQLPPVDEHSDEDTLAIAWRNPNPLSRVERRARAEQLSGQMPPQLTDSVDLIREDRNR